VEKLNQKYKKLIQALSTLEKASQTLTIFVKEGVSYNPHLDYKEEYRGLRDSAIQRFEYSVDLYWKYLKIYLEKVLALPDINGPKPVIRKSYSSNALNEEEAEESLKMIDDRNMTSHIYVEEIAEHLAAKIPSYYMLMHNVAARLVASTPFKP